MNITELTKIINERKLTFLERDYKCPSSDSSIESGCSYLECWLNVDSTKINEMDIQFQYQLTKKEDLIKLLFDKARVLVSYSMYVQGSDSDFTHFVTIAGRNDVADLVYIDCSGMIVKFLNNSLMESKNAIDIICGINRNTIITRGENMNPVILKIDIRGKFEDCVKLIPFSNN